MKHKMHRLHRVSLLAAGLVIVTAGPVGAQVTLNPTEDGMPGAGVFQSVLNWGGQLALYACLAAFFVGGGYWGWAHFSGRSQGAHKGQMLTIGGAVGALLVGVAPVAINTLFNAGVAGG